MFIIVVSGVELAVGVGFGEAEGLLSCVVAVWGGIWVEGSRRFGDCKGLGGQMCNWRSTVRCKHGEHRCCTTFIRDTPGNDSTVGLSVQAASSTQSMVSTVCKTCYTKFWDWSAIVVDRCPGSNSRCSICVWRSVQRLNLGTGFSATV